MTDRAELPEDVTQAMKELEALRVRRVGSRVTCDPAPVGTDVDYLILAMEHRERTLSSLGFEVDGSADYESSNGTFKSWRRGELNLIVTEDVRFYERFVLATEVARELNLLEKKDRIVLFQAILYSNVLKQEPDVEALI